MGRKGRRRAVDIHQETRLQTGGMSESVGDSKAAAAGRFSVLLGGDLTPTPRLLSQSAGTRAIAADSGIAHAARLGLDVELWVGDFDSASAAMQASSRHLPRQTHPTDKDKTDGEIAIDAALARGAAELLLIGALGGQTDHALGNLALLLSLARRGVPSLASSGNEEAYALLPGRMTLELPPGSRLSLIALEDLVGLDLAGVRWPLSRARIGVGSTRTLSNVAIARVEIGLETGTGIVLAYPAGP